MIYRFTARYGIDRLKHWIEKPLAIATVTVLHVLKSMDQTLNQHVEATQTHCHELPRLFASKKVS